MINELYADAILAAAAYADWDRDEVTITAKLKEKGLTDQQVETFFNPANGLYLRPNAANGDFVDLGEGFSATVFRLSNKRGRVA